MSTQKGNLHRQRPQKYQNKSAFKNNLHDTSKTTQMLNSMEITGLCQRCKEQIEWRIKFKKYKSLSAPKKCVKCEQKTVKRAYTTVCEACGSRLKVCLKCLQPVEEASVGPPHSAIDGNEMKQRLQSELKFLSERQRRTYERSVRDGKIEEQQHTDLLHTLDSSSGLGASNLEAEDDDV